MQHNPQNVNVTNAWLGRRNACSFEEAASNKLGAGHKLDPGFLPHLMPSQGKFSVFIIGNRQCICRVSSYGLDTIDASEHKINSMYNLSPTSTIVSGENKLYAV